MSQSALPFPDAEASPRAAARLAADLALPASVGHLDELRGIGGEPGAVAPAWEQFFGHLGPEGFGDLNRRAQSLARQIRDNGVTYNVYADDHGHQRPWSLDLFPMIVSPEDWAGIEAGIGQRVRLLDSILRDVYGERRLLQQAMLPAALIQGHPGYLRAMQGVRPLGDTWLHIAAFDLARGPDGQWWVVSQRTQAPSGLGYLLENRIAIGRQFPVAFGEMKVQRLAASYRALMQGLQSLMPQGRAANIALLTPGPYNETYFEHAFLARYLGLNLVTGDDLTVRDQRLYLKTIKGLEPVDGLIKRVDDEWLDPLELRTDSALGVPGLLQVLRAGNVLLANAPGSAPLESSAILAFLPKLCEHLLGEQLALPSLATWWCGEAATLERALPVVDKAVIKPTNTTARFDAMMGQSLDAEGLARLRARMIALPEDHTLQDYLPLSQNPTWIGDAIAPRSAMLRVFALCDGAQSWRVLPGGLVRLAQRGQLIASMQRGGSSADCWVLTHDEVDRTSLLQSAPSTLSLAQTKRPVTSRAAENLFWLGRYCERAENSLRMAQIVLRTLQGENQRLRGLLQWLDSCARDAGLVVDDVPDLLQSRRVFERSLIASMAHDSEATSVGYNIRALQQAAASVRERLSQEQRNLIDRLQSEFDAQCGAINVDAEYAPQEALEALDEASEILSAITGAQTDHMVRDDGWRMLSVGRHLERLGTLSHAMRAGIQTGSVFQDAGFEALLTLFDSTITFHSRYQQRRDPLALLDTLVLDRDNPRSLGYVLSTLRTRLNKLHQHSLGSGLPPGATAPDPDHWDLAMLGDSGDEGFASLVELLTHCEQASYALSDEINQRYFSHASSRHHSLLI